MDIKYEKEGAKERIISLALDLSGLDSAPEAGEALFEAAVNAALNLCGRRDVPYAMEPNLSLILADLYREGLHKPFSSVKRGDTSITYASAKGVFDAKALLSPFIRLGAI